MGKGIVLASCLNDNQMANAFAQLVAERWEDKDVSPFMAYLVDICAPAALPYLADQFDIDGVKGFEMAVNEEQQRALIKRSIGLHKYIGTTWAIREACRSVGFDELIIEEGVTAIPGGPTSPEDWARFSVYLKDVGENRSVTADEWRKMRLFIEFYKNERSHLIDLGFYITYSEKLFRHPEDQREDFAIQFEYVMKPLRIAGSVFRVVQNGNLRKL